LTWDGSTYFSGGQNFVAGPQLNTSFNGINWINQTSSISTFVTSVNDLQFNSNTILSYKDQNLAIPGTTIPYYPVSTNILTTFTSTLLINNTLYINGQNNTTKIVGIYPSSVMSVNIVSVTFSNQYDVEVVGPGKFSTLTLGTFSGFSTIGPSGLRLALTDGNAYKRTSANWLITSDQRLKDNIIDADKDICYQTIQQISLRRFEYSDSFTKITHASDKRVLGFVAQEVSSVIPKAIYTEQGYGLSNLLTLSVDQIQFSQVGALQKVISDTEAMESTAFSLVTLTSDVTARISTLNGYLADRGGNV
jgi:hypothetical protein